MRPTTSILLAWTVVVSAIPIQTPASSLDQEWTANRTVAAQVENPSLDEEMTLDEEMSATSPTGVVDRETTHSAGNAVHDLAAEKVVHDLAANDLAVDATGCKDECSPNGGLASNSACTPDYCDHYKTGGNLRSRCAVGAAGHNYAVAECAATCGLCGTDGGANGGINPEVSTDEFANILADYPRSWLTSCDKEAASSFGMKSASAWAGDEAISTSEAELTKTVFTRWGATTCPLGTTTLYSGFVAGAHYTHVGSGANYLCMHPSPEYPPGALDANNDGALLYGTE
jgi:hypothetical protein